MQTHRQGQTHKHNKELQKTIFAECTRKINECGETLPKRSKCTENYKYNMTKNNLK